MDANQDSNRTCPDSIGTCPDSNRTCPDSWLEAYADWCEEKVACRLRLANIRASLGDYYTDEDTYLVTNEAACWLTAANLARGCYTSGAWS
jgi:alpha-mannosidase